MVARMPGAARARGAAVFIVVLVITLLTAIGIFAARAASLVDVAVGHNRQALQTLYLADYGARTSLAMMSGQTCDIYVKQMYTSEDVCDTNRHVTLTPQQLDLRVTRVPCYTIPSSDASERAGMPLLAAQLATQPGSLGPATHGSATSVGWSLNGLWVTELTEPVQVSAGPGQDESNSPYVAYRITATTYAQIRTGGADWCGNTNSATGASLHAVRTHVILPDCTRAVIAALTGTP